MDKNQLATKEDVTLIRMVLVELSRRFELDKSIYSTSVQRYRGDNDFDDGEGNNVRVDDVAFKGSSTKIEIDYRPDRNPQSQTKDISVVSISWTPQTGQFFVFLSYLQPSTPGNRHRNNEEHDCAFHIGMGNKSLNGEYASLKKEFLALYKKIKEYSDVELPRRQREAFENAVYETFPTLLDEVLMEEGNESKEG